MLQPLGIPFRIPQPQFEEHFEELEEHMANQENTCFLLHMNSNQVFFGCRLYVIKTYFFKCKLNTNYACVLSAKLLKNMEIK